MVMSEENMNDIVVSVCMLAYNHEQFIAKAIDSVLSQHFQYKYEIVIGEDCSTDSTLSICKEYAAKYPQIIRLLAHPTNQGLIKNYVSVMNAARGKYIAVCSGDDYWCDERKLLKQVDFMESNPDYSMCFTNAYEESNFSWEGYRKHLFSEVQDRDYYGTQIILKWIVPASSVMFKNKLLDFSFLLSREFYAEDLVQYLKLNEYGKIRGMSDVTTVYTRHEAAITGVQDNNEKALCRYVANLLSVDAELNNKYHDLINEDLTITFYKNAKASYKRGNKKKAFIYYKNSIKYNPKLAFVLLWKSIVN